MSTEQKSKGGCLKAIGVFVGVMLILSLIANIIDSFKSPEQKQKEAKEREAAQVQEAISKANTPDAERDLKVKKHTWEKGGFGAVGLHNFSIYNPSKFTYKDPVVRIIYYGESNTVIHSSESTVYKLIPAGKTIRIRDFNDGFISQQAASANVEIISARSM